jgi:alginate O-acetyltransferase complex protein AlgJ
MKLLLPNRSPARAVHLPGCRGYSHPQMASTQTAAHFNQSTRGRRPSGVRTLLRKLIAAAFLACLFTVFAGTWFHWDPAESRENRILSRWPGQPRNFAQVKQFSDRALEFFRDHFGFRNLMIRGVALMKYRGIGERNQNRVIVGKDGWLFYAADDKFLADRALDPFSNQDLDQWQELLEKRHKWFADRRIVFLVVIPPDKQTIYPEYMPDEFAHPPRPTRLDQLIARLKERNSPVQIIDLRPALLEAKKVRQVYFTTDSHWDDDGIYPAYVALLKSVAQALPDFKLQPQPAGNFIVRPDTRHGDLAQQLDLWAEYHEKIRRWVRRDLLDNPRLFADLPTISYTDGDPKGPRLLTYNDSFTAYMIQFLAPNFSHGTYAWNAWTESMDPAPVKDAKPDVVICEFVEWKLYNPLPVDAPPIANVDLRSSR